MDVITFSEGSLAQLSGEGKREIRVAVALDGSQRGWHMTASGVLVIWITGDQRTLVGLATEAADFAHGRAVDAAWPAFRRS